MLPLQPDRPRCKPDLLVPIPIQCVAGLLFLLGLPWAFLAGWACLLNLFGGIEQVRLAIREGDPVQVDQVLARMLLVIAGTAQAVWGYTIWVGWWRIAGDQKVASRRFWFRATWHHMIWAALLLGVMLWPVSGSHLSIDGSMERFVLGYILGVGFICGITGWVLGDLPHPSKPIPND